MCECKKRIEVMEKKILYLTGNKREQARREYLELLNSCSEECGLEEPMYYRRS